MGKNDKWNCNKVMFCSYKNALFLNSKRTMLTESFRVGHCFVAVVRRNCQNKGGLPLTVFQNGPYFTSRDDKSHPPLPSLSVVQSKYDVTNGHHMTIAPTRGTMISSRGTGNVVFKWLFALLVL